VNGRPAPQHPLARPLRACARGIYPDEAAIELLIGHGTFLDRDDFTRHITTGQHGNPGGEAAHAAIDWTAATTALDAGTLPCSALLTELRDVSAAQKVELPCRSVTTLTGTSRSACRGGRDLDLSSTESGHSVLNSSPASSSLLLVNTSPT